MIKLGRKIKDMLGSPMMAASIELDDDEVRYPSVYLDHLDGDDLNDIKVGEEVTLIGKVISKKISEREKGDPYYCFDVEVHKLDAKGISKDVESDDEDDDEDSDQKAVKRGLDKAEKNKDKSNGY